MQKDGEVIKPDLPKPKKPADSLLYFPEKLQPQGKRYFLIVLLVIVFLSLIGSGIFVYQRAVSNRQTAEEEVNPPADELVEEIEPTTAPESELKRADLNIKVLNGSGAPGTAGKAQQFLEDLGYEEIEADNAGSYDYQETEIAIKKDKEDYLEMLTDDLSEKYTLAAETELLDENSEFDAVITVGN